VRDYVIHSRHLNAYAIRADGIDIGVEIHIESSVHTIRRLCRIGHATKIDWAMGRRVEKDEALQL
jgi:hypothetical protein